MSVEVQLDLGKALRNKKTPQYPCEELAALQAKPLSELFQPPVGKASSSEGGARSATAPHVQSGA